MTVRKAILVFLILSGVLLRWHLFTKLDHDRTLCGTDFPVFYAAGKLAFSGQLYTGVLAEHHRVTGCMAASSALFIKPPYFAALLWPIAQLPFAMAFLLWRLLLGVCIIALIAMWRGYRLELLAAAAWSMPIANNLIEGQDVLVLAVAVTGAYLLLKRGGWELTAGILLGLCAAKPHLFLLLPWLLVKQRMWRALAGAALTVSVLILASFAVAGPHWVSEMYAAVRNPATEPYLRAQPTLRALSVGAPMLRWAFTIIVALLAWRLSSRLDTGFLAATAGGILVAPHAGGYDLVLLLPFMLLALQWTTWPPIRALAVFMCTPLACFFDGHGILQAELFCLLLLVMLEFSNWRIEAPWGYQNAEVTR